MHANAFFTIGKIHIVCDDYATAGHVANSVTDKRMAYAVVSDGCSSSANSDFGARLLTVSAVHHLSHPFFSKALMYNMILSAEDMLKAMPSSFLGPSVLDATLMLARQEESDKVRTIINGDGFVLARRRDGIVECYNVDFENMPPYLSYIIYKEKGETYRRHICDFNKAKIVHKREFLDGNTITDTNESVWLAEKEREDQDPLFSWSLDEWEFRAATHDLIILATDGINTFNNADGNPVPIGSVIKELTNIKTFNGEFMVRRMKSFLNKFCTTNGWQHYDDIGVAAIHLDM